MDKNLEREKKGARSRLPLRTPPSKQRIEAALRITSPAREWTTVVARQENLTHGTNRHARADALVRRLLLGVTTLCLAGVVYGGILAPLLALLIPLEDLLGFTPPGTVVFVLFSLGHAWYRLGWRPTLAFFSLTAVITWVFEEVGVATSTVYGAYHFHDALWATLVVQALPAGPPHCHPRVPVPGCSEVSQPGLPSCPVGCI